MLKYLVISFGVGHSTTNPPCYPDIMIKVRSLISGICVLTVGASDAIAQMQTITTYGNNSFPQTTIISPTYNGGYNYSTIGGPHSGSWGGVTASPGTQVSATVTSRGEVVPIVNPAPRHDILDQVAEQNAAINAQIAAQNAALLSLPLPPINSGQAVTYPARAVPPALLYRTPQPPPPNSSAYQQYIFLYNQFTPAAMKQISKDWLTDSQLRQQDRVDPHALLAYTKAWLRFHPYAIKPPVNQLTSH